MQTEQRPASNPVWDFVSAPPDLALPDFSAFTPEHLHDAARRAIEHQETRIARIRSASTDPTFANTTLQLGEAGHPLFRLQALVRVIEANLLTEEWAEPVAEVTQVLLQARLHALLDGELFSRLEHVPTSELNPVDRRRHELQLLDAVRAGARLDLESRSHAGEIIAEIEALSSEFTRILRQESHDRALHLTDPEALAGLGETARGAAAREAAERGVEGWVLPLANTSQQPALAQLTDPRTRAELFAASLSRGSQRGPGDLREIVSDITTLRAALAGLLGYRSYAGYAIDAQTANSPDAAGGLLAALVDPALARLAEELATIRERWSPDRLEAADISHWVQRLVAEESGLDPARIAEYFELDRVLFDGVFYAAHNLYGVEFSERRDMPAWHPDVRVFEAFEDGRVIGIVCLDACARPGKGGGAWMDQLVSQGRLTGEKPIVTLSLNLTPAAPGAPQLLSPDETITLFHEFGHVLHGLFSNSTYPSLSGTAVPRDYVEFPSQLNEMWAFHPQVLPNYAVHVHTGEPLPAAEAERLRRARTLGQGFRTVEYLAAALLDLGWHSLDPGDQVTDVLAFEAEVLAATGLDSLVPPRYRTTYFAHIFGNGYAAGYYSYLWSEVIAAHAAEWFEAHGGLDFEAGSAFRREILAPGNAVHPMTAIIDFFGGVPPIDALLRRRGLDAAEPGGSGTGGDPAAESTTSAAEAGAVPEVDTSGAGSPDDEDAHHAAPAPRGD